MGEAEWFLVGVLLGAGGVGGVLVWALQRYQGRS